MSPAPDPENASPGGAFELTFVDYRSGDYEVEAQLKSDALDGEVFPGGAVTIVFQADEMTKGSKPRFTLSSFHFDSLRDLLQLQPLIRATLTEQLAIERNNWATNPKPSDHFLAGAKVMRVVCPQKQSLSEGDIEDMRRLMPKASFEKHMAAQNTAETFSVFQVVLKCPWDRDHNVVLRFRDRTFLNLGHE